jgi:hypothetical protein
MVRDKELKEEREKPSGSENIRQEATPVPPK